MTTIGHQIYYYASLETAPIAVIRTTAGEDRAHLLAVREAPPTAIEYRLVAEVDLGMTSLNRP